jgi:glucose-6-phosphate-specific signal transduction histidine kinase
MGEGPHGASPPWPLVHPMAAAGVAGGLFVAIAGLRFSVEGHADAVSMLFVLPIALLAVAFGIRGGLVGAVAGIGLLVLWSVATGATELSIVGWLTRVTALFLLGGLLGSSTDRLMASERRARLEQAQRMRLEEDRRRQVEALEINDMIVQGIAAAKWAAEAGQIDRAIEVLASTLEVSQELVAGILPRVVRANGHADAQTGLLLGR